MKKKYRLALIVVCLLVLLGIRVFSPEDTRICDWNTLVKHGNPSATGSRFFSFEKNPQDLKCLSWKLLSFSLLPIHYTWMKITTDFLNNGSIPIQHTCDGEGIFPRLIIEDIPMGTKSLVLIVDDPDAPSGVRDHILLANIPSSESDILVVSQDTFDLWILWQNSRWEQAWWAPCPPSWTHRYVFKIYALSENLEISSWFSKERLLELMWGRLLDQAKIVGLYQR